MGEDSGTIYITKLAAAQRQLRAAIRMFFSGEDELAVHTVAFAAYKVLSDLKADRGRDEAGDYFLMRSSTLFVPTVGGHFQAISQMIHNR